MEEPQTKKSPFEEFVDSKTTEEKKIDWEARKTLWLTKVNSLYLEIEDWFSDLKKLGKITISKGQDIHLSEDYIGSYVAPTLEISIGAEKVKLSPIGTLIIGGQGRIDVTGKSGKIMLILSHKDYRPGVTVHTSTSKEEADEYKRKQREELKARPEPTAKDLIWLYVRRTHKMEYFPLTKDLFEEIIMSVSGR